MIFKCKVTEKVERRAHYWVEAETSPEAEHMAIRGETIAEEHDRFSDEIVERQIKGPPLSAEPEEAPPPGTCKELRNPEVCVEVYDLAKKLGIRTLVRGDAGYHPNRLVFQGVVATGRFDQLGDYGQGLLRIRIGAMFLCGGKPEGLREVQILLTTIDDGCWRAVAAPLETEAADALATRIAEDFAREFSKVLPTENRLNEWLRQFGLWGMYEG